MKEKKPKVKKIKNGSKITAHSLLFIGLSLILTFALFLGLIFVQNYLSEEITYQQVLVAKQEIPVGFILTAENASEYLEYKQINVLDITSDNLQNPDALYGMKAKVRLVKGETVMVKDFEDVVSYIEQFENPVEMSIAAPDASNADGGKLRAGDMINITLQYSNTQIVDSSYDTGVVVTNNQPVNILSDNGSEQNFADISQENNAVLDTDDTNGISIENVTPEVTEEITDWNAASPQTTNVPLMSQSSTIKITNKAYNFENQYAYLLEGVYIHKVLDANGNEIAPEDTESVASILVLIVDRSAEIELNEMLENGASMRISKILDKEKYLAVMKEESSQTSEENEILTETPKSDTKTAESEENIIPEEFLENTNEESVTETVSEENNLQDSVTDTE